MMRSLLPLLLLSGCTWVTQSEKDALYPILDNDGDGYKNEDDCAPEDATIHPKAEETWYDGVDQNCDKLNDFDVDGDGYIAAGYDADQEASVPEADRLPGNDCCDSNPMISPKQPEVYYDGVDQNCDTKDDFDADQDSYVGEVSAITTRIPAPICPEAMQEQGEGTDCDDADTDIHPGAADTCYDGINADCGLSDDFDCDGDGVLEEGDCNDQDPSVSPVLEEVWYNGVDENCDTHNDFDQDGDGFIPDEYVAQQAAAYPNDQLPSGDCDDQDGTINPHVSEDISDRIDSDCDGNTRTFRVIGLTENNWVIDNPLAVQYGQVDGFLYLGVNADHFHAEFNSGAKDDLYDGTIGLRWDSADGTVDSTSVAMERWDTSIADTARSALPAEDLQIIDGVLYNVGAINKNVSGSDFPRFSLYQSSLGTASNGEVSSPRSPPADVAVAVETTGQASVFACNDESGVLSYLRVDSTGDRNFVEVSDMSASACTADVVEGDVRYIAQEGANTSGARLVEYSVTWDTQSSQATFTPTGTEWAADAYDVDLPAGLADRVLVVADRVTGAIKIFDGASSTTVGYGDHPNRVALREDANGKRILGYVTQTGAATFAYDTGSGYSTIAITLPTNLVATDIAVWPVEGVGVYVAVAGAYPDGSGDVAVGLVKGL